MSDRNWAAEYSELTAQMSRNATEFGYRTEDVWARNYFAMKHFPTVAGELDNAQCEIERQRGDLVIERRRAEAAEAALKRVRELTYASDDGLEYDHNGPASVCGEPECPACWAQAIRKALDGDS